ncbi:hypothetical protein EJ05DRAFT_225763 [Pseudovirgaria hyperparasitica]|uniref:L-ornithine N(5)-monooxygenase [NAD(P)H] n=1 Tax=Pseudovirgaria hyperparasitica TaxID=470096 RepID=A0A6A6VSH6_9PEZI|nr:uncharacterized protein EJ05DRAFT_225763 [Pseudovirgaria hyperparasitica]KAF2753105.1 hypothetical protein EJ05DRAFT_225763 [Pseudovirgaria hyperparasitica]
MSIEASSTGAVREAPCSLAASKTGSYDYVFVGFGPSSLSLAIAIHEHDASKRIVILEQQHRFHWKPSAFLPTNHMRTSFLQDLAMQRNPRSEFTFVNYSWEAGGRGGSQQMDAWLNLGSMKPSREVWGQYLAWAAQKLENMPNVEIKYGKEVIGTKAVNPPPVAAWNVAAKDTVSQTVDILNAKKIIFATGAKMRIPPELRFIGLDNRVVHTGNFAELGDGLTKHKNEPSNVAVVGANNEAVEVFMHLHAALPNATGTLFVNDRTLRPTDGSPFTAQLLHTPTGPSRILPYELRRKSPSQPDQPSKPRPTVAEENLNGLYEMLYMQKVAYRAQRKNKFAINFTHTVSSLTPTPGSPKVTIRLTPNTPVTTIDVPENKPYDLVVLATGDER